MNRQRGGKIGELEQRKETTGKRTEMRKTMSRVWLVVERGRRKRVKGKKRMDKQIEGKKK